MAQKHLSEDEIRYTVTAETQKAQKEIHQLQQSVGYGSYCKMQRMFQTVLVKYPLKLNWFHRIH